MSTTLPESETSTSDTTEWNHGVSLAPAPDKNQGTNVGMAELRQLLGTTFSGVPPKMNVDQEGLLAFTVESGKAADELARSLNATIREQEINAIAGTWKARSDLGKNK